MQKKNSIGLVLFTLFITQQTQTHTETTPLLLPQPFNVQYRESIVIAKKSKLIFIRFVNIANLIKLRLSAFIWDRKI